MTSKEETVTVTEGEQQEVTIQEVSGTEGTQEGTQEEERPVAMAASPPVIATNPRNRGFGRLSIRRLTSDT
jgi:hypothetical protein